LHYVVFLPEAGKQKCRRQENRNAGGRKTEMPEAGKQKCRRQDTTISATGIAVKQINPYSGLFAG